MKLFIRRQLIYYKNHVDAFALYFTAIALIIFTLAIYVYTPLDSILTQARWPWAQGENDPKAPLGMIQFFACLFSILNVLVVMNYRSSKKVVFAVIFYLFTVVQFVNDVYYIYEVNRHIANILKPEFIEYPAKSGIAFTYVHIVFLVLSALTLAFAPLIQKYTSKIRLKPVSSQDKDLQ